MNQSKYLPVDTWENTYSSGDIAEETYHIFQDQEDPEYFLIQGSVKMANYAEWERGSYTYEDIIYSPSGRPSREEVESRMTDFVSETHLNDYECEFGADGRRNFPNL